MRKRKRKWSLGVSKGEVVATAKNAIFRTWTGRSYSSVHNTGTRIVYKHFIRFITAGRFPANAQTQARYSWVTAGARGYMGLSTEAKGRALKSRVTLGRGLRGVFNINSVSVTLGEQTPEKWNCVLVYLNCRCFLSRALACEREF